MCFLKIRRPPRSTRSDTLLPYTTLLRLIAPLSRLDCGAELHRLGRWPMHSASYRYSSNLSRGSRWRRAIALFLAVLVHALLIIMLLRQAPPPSRLLEDRKSTRLNSSTNAHLVCRLLIEQTKHNDHIYKSHLQ